MLGTAMVAIPLGVRAPELSPLDSSPRDWSHKWDGHEPPQRGEFAYCILLLGVRKKANWRPRTPDSEPPVAFVLGSMADWWGRHYWIVERDVREFNLRQMKRVATHHKERITLWAMAGYGCCGFYETVRVIRKGGGA